ncbi:hypothetical protein AVEN_174028-1 [Araneus ventricosus]|uniref:Uncharacterized protein n=1 Tax=Araneus ventricosus TaxID=182803 RepID=A0A4Y2J5W2_ARAVE|nr:hypothetical protein AVEN_174028-1 [Araneus ventricosus]
MKQFRILDHRGKHGQRWSRATTATEDGVVHWRRLWLGVSKLSMTCILQPQEHTSSRVTVSKGFWTGLFEDLPVCPAHF